MAETSKPSETAYGGEQQGGRLRSRTAFLALGGGAAAGAVVTALYALQADSAGQYFAVVTVGLMVAGAALLAGGFLGFLFGIPRTLQQEAVVTVAEAPTTPQPEGAAVPEGEGEGGTRATVERPRYRANTNLEQISDWLTKILVGVGLTQLGKIPERSRELAATIASGMGAFPGAEAYALALLLFYSVLGFLLGFLWTRLFLEVEFSRADVAVDTLRGEIAAVGRKAEASVEEVRQTAKSALEDYKQQAGRDVDALSKARQQLNPSAELPEISQQDLNEAVANASGATRAQILNEAWSVRSDTWRDEKPKMERTIAVFRALVASDPEGRYHMNHGQLAFALKDKEEPDWEEARREFDKAIEIRGPWYEARRWLFYEFSRALCRIKLEPRVEAGKASDPQLRSEIVADLSAAWSALDVQPIIEGDPDISAWMKLNRVTTDDLEKEFERVLEEHEAEPGEEQAEDES